MKKIRAQQIFYSLPTLGFAAGLLLSSTQAQAACGTNTFTWAGAAGAARTWKAAANWSPATNWPGNTANDNAVATSGSTQLRYPGGNVSLKCMTIAGGTTDFSTNGAGTLTITGDYFRNLYTGGIKDTAGTGVGITMAGTAAQTFENVDPIENVTIANGTSVEFTQPFSITSSLTINTGSGTLYIDKEVDVNNLLTIPVSSTIEIKNGGILNVNSGITVNGTLKIDAGGKLLLGDGTILTVNASGLLILNGAPGNVAVIDADGGQSFGTNIAGTINANYFSITRDRVPLAGMNITGTIQQLNNGEFHYIGGGGYAITLGASATSATTWTNLAFIDDSTFGNCKAVNSSAYTGSQITINQWSGLNTQNGTKITFGTQAAPALEVTNSGNIGFPTATTAAGSGDTIFGQFGFNLNQTATATNITSIKFTLSGNNLASDITQIDLFSGVCGSNGTTNIGTGTFSGYPPTATITLSPAQSITSTKSCMAVHLTPSSTARTGDTVAVEIAGTSDVVDSQNYGFSISGGPAITLGLSTITGGATLNQWDGSNGTPPFATWGTNANWSANSVPSSTVDCQVGNAYTYPRLTATTFTCQNVTLAANGTIDWNNTAGRLDVYGGLVADASYNFINAASGVINLRGSVNQSVNFQTTWPGSVTINSTGGQVNIDNDWTINGGLTLTTGTLSVNAGQTLTVLGNLALNGGNLIVQPGGKLKFGNGSVMTVAAAGTLTLVGTASNRAVVTSTGTSNAYTVVVNGTISANYYSFSNLGTAGVTINSGATINATNKLLNGSFTYPVANSTVLLTLNRQVPGNALSGMTFDSNGSTATGVIGIKTNAASGTLAISSYTGDRSGTTYTTAPTYLVSWTGLTNTLKLTQEATSPSSLLQGTTYTMGRFGFQQTQAGSGFSDTDLTALTLTMTGTATASDISQVRLYYDSSCAGSGGTLIATGTFSGIPAVANFALSTGAATIQHSATAPPKRCIYVQYDIDPAAINNLTAGAQISASGDVTNSQSYAFNGAFAPIVDLGTGGTIVGSSTVWSGATSTAWATAGNWNGGVPTSALNCIIHSATNNPVISAAGAICKSLIIDTGTLTINTGQNLDLYGSLSKTGGTLTQTGTATLTLRDSGTPSNQTLQSNTTLTSVSFNKTLGGNVYIGNSTLTINALTIPASQNFTFEMVNGDTLTLPNGMSIASAQFQVDGGATVNIGSGKAITVSGTGNFTTNGTNDAYPQVTTNKALLTVVGGTGTWSFTATAGTVDLTGFLFDYLDVNGLNIGGTTTLASLDGGQFTHLSQTYASVKPIQLNTTGSIPGTASNVGWNWGVANGSYVNPPSPTPTTTYKLATSTGCANQTITFNQWFGDFFVGVNTPDPQTKVSTASCTINITAAASPVNLLSFTATPYDGKVVLNWATGLEWSHQGFNVYRSYSPIGGYAQINPDLVRNSVLGTTIHGSYQFYDSGVINDVTYYYMIEDFALNGVRTMHGPVSAIPTSGLIVAPAPDGSAIQSGNTVADSAPTPVPFAPDQVVLAPGVTQLSKTKHSFRLQFDIADIATTPAENAPYVRLSIPNFALTTVAGFPELAERVVMVEIPAATAATFSTVSNTTKTWTSIQVAPANQWTAVGGNLVPSWTLDSSFYAISQALPANPISLGTITQSQGVYFLPVIIDPLAFNPVAQTVLQTSQIIIDVNLDGTPAWAPAAAAPTVWGTEAGLKISVTQAGLYQLAYSDFTSAGVDGPFAGQDITRFKLYSRDQEIPLDTTTSNGAFGGTDTIRFFAPYYDTYESNDNTLLLVADAGSSTLGARMATLNGTTTSMPVSTEFTFNRSVHTEQSTIGLFNEPYAENVDHIFWTQIYAPAGSPGDDTLTATVQLPNAVPTGNATVSVMLKGSRSSTISNPVHHLGLIVNSMATTAADIVFTSSGPYMATFTVPANLFTVGLNSITLKVLGDMVPSGDYDLVNIDYFNIEYPHAWIADSDVADATTTQSGSVLDITGFTGNDILVYDITDPAYTASVSNATITAQSGGLYDAAFASISNDSSHGRRFWVTRQSVIPKPVSLRLNPGSSLQATTQGADVIYIGPAALLDSVEPLAELRAREGLRVKLVSLEDIYSEFGQGLKSATAVKDFLKFAVAQWQTPVPGYVVLVGDGTTDPKNALGLGTTNTLPTHLLKGAFIDYGSDNWFVALNANDALPGLAIGRIPGNSPALITTYVNKVLSYEQGTSRPQATAGNFVFIADVDQIGGEHFAQRAQAVSTLLPSWNNALSASTILRSTLSDANLKAAINDAFNAGPTLIHYIGHGAEDQWADSAVFTNADADLLTNSTLPIVTAMNCLNGSYYYADPTSQTLMDRLLFNPAGGAIAVWASTSLTNPDTQTPFQAALYQIIAQTPGIRLGDAIRLAKVTTGWSAGSDEVINSWALFGDPLITVRIPNAAGAAITSSSSSGGGASHGSGGMGCGTTGRPPEPPSAGGTLMFSMVLYLMYILAHRLPAGARRRNN